MANKMIKGCNYLLINEPTLQIIVFLYIFSQKIMPYGNDS